MGVGLGVGLCVGSGGALCTCCITGALVAVYLGEEVVWKVEPVPVPGVG